VTQNILNLDAKMVGYQLHVPSRSGPEEVLFGLTA